jgi:predicted PurR-regulated permease PerM
MKTERLYTTISLAIIFVLFYLFYRVLSPFLTTIAWAMVLSITFYPLYKMLLKLIKRPWIASLATLIIILILIIGPFTYIVGSLVKEITDIYSTIEEKGFEAITKKIREFPGFASVVNTIGSYITLEDFNLREGAIKTLKSIGKYIGEHISDLFKNAVVLVVNFIIMCLTIFYFLKDGETLTNYIKGLLPFPETQKKRLEQRVKEMVIAAIHGGLAVGIVQGTLGGFAFFIFGLPSPVFWGTTMAIFSLVPLFGTFIIWGPASLILILTGSYLKGIGLLLYGVLIISTVDNILKPLIIGGRTKLHTLLVFFSVLGGIKFLGFLGFILGPLIAALCLSLLEIYKYEEAEQLE